MSAEDDKELIQKRIEQLKAKGDSLKDTIENEKQNNQILILLRSEYDKMRKDFLNEEQKNLKKIQKFSLRVKKARNSVTEIPENNFQLNDHDLEIKENDLMTEIEKMEKVTFQLECETQKFDEIKKQQNDVNLSIDKLEDFVLKYDNISRSLLNSSRLFMKISDLEAQKAQLEIQIPVLNEKLKKQKEINENFKIDNSLKISEFRRMQASIDGKIADISINKSTISRLLLILSNCNLDLQKSKQKYNTHDQKDVELVDKAIENTQLEIEEMKMKIVQMEKENKNFPDIIKDEEYNSRKRIQKKKQLNTELKRKINEIKNEILIANSSSDTVMNLNVQMEKIWKEQQRMEETASKLETKLLRLQEDLERKKYMRIEIENIMKKYVNKRENGFKSLDVLFSVAQNENKAFASQVNKLNMDYNNAKKDLEKIKSRLASRPY